MGTDAWLERNAGNVGLIRSCANAERELYRSAAGSELYHQAVRAGGGKTHKARERSKMGRPESGSGDPLLLFYAFVQ